MLEDDLQRASRRETRPGRAKGKYVACDGSTQHQGQPSCTYSNGYSTLTAGEQLEDHVCCLEFADTHCPLLEGESLMSLFFIIIGADKCKELSGVHYSVTANMW